MAATDSPPRTDADDGSIVSRPKGHGTSIFDKMYAKRDDMPELFISEEALPDAALGISDDLKLKLKKQHERLVGNTSGVSVGDKRGRDPALDSPSMLPSEPDSMPETIDSYDDSESDAAAAGGRGATTDEFTDDFYSFGAAPGPDRSHLVQLGGPNVSGVDASYDPRQYAVVLRTLPGNKQCPWAIPLWAVRRFQRTGQLYCPTNAAVALHQEISDLMDWLRLTEPELAMRRLIELQLADIATSLWPNCEPCAYGSMSTRLVLPTSDLDVSILNVPCNTEDALVAIAGRVKEEELGATTWPQMILKTKVPLIKFATKLGGIEVDVSVNAADGKHNSAIVNRMCDQYPESRTLITVVKYFLQQREMNEPFKGTLGSFATTLLVLSFLQQHPIYTTRCQDRPNYGVGRLLVDFFRYYSLCWNYHRVALTLANGGSCYQRGNTAHDGGPRGPQQIVITDPGNAENNVASSVRWFQTIQTAFEGAYHALTADPGVTATTREVDPGIVNPGNRQVIMRPTLLSRIIHSDSEVVKRREKAQAGYERWAEEHSEMAERVGAYRQTENAALLQLQVRERYDQGRQAPPPPQQQQQQQQQRHQQQARQPPQAAMEWAQQNPYAKRDAAPPQRAPPPSKQHQQQQQQYPTRQQPPQHQQQQPYQQQQQQQQQRRNPPAQQQQQQRRRAVSSSSSDDDNSPAFWQTKSARQPARRDADGRPSGSKMRRSE